MRYAFSVSTLISQSMLGIAQASMELSPEPTSAKQDEQDYDNQHKANTAKPTSPEITTSITVITSTQTSTQKQDDNDDKDSGSSQCPQQRRLQCYTSRQWHQCASGNLRRCCMRAQRRGCTCLIIPQSHLRDFARCSANMFTMLAFVFS